MPPAQAIAAYREALLRGAPAAELERLAANLDSEIVAWLDLFQASRREAIRPDPAFVRRLDRIVAKAPGPKLARSPLGSLMPLRLVRSHTANGRRQELNAQATIPVRPSVPWQTAWSQSAARLAAAMLLIALLIGSVWTALYPLRIWDPERLPIFAVHGSPETAETAARLEFLWESEGGPEGMSFPFGLGVDPAGNVWVADSRNDRVQILAPDGTYLETLGSSGDGEGEFEFYSPRSRYGNPYGDVGFDADGNIYVVDTGNFRVQKFAPDRSFLFAWGTEGEADGQFLAAGSIAVGPDGTVYVSDENKLVIQAFDANGRFLRSIAVPEAENRRSESAGITVDAGGDIWLADYGASRILRLSPSGELLAEWGTPGGRDGELSGPNDVAVDAAGHVFVADSHNNRLQVFTVDGQFLARSGGSGYDEPGTFSWALGVAVAENGVIFVTDANRVQAFRLILPAWDFLMP
jgi:DNA-binding beta-propeller fold protein YncE